MQWCINGNRFYKLNGNEISPGYYYVLIIELDAKIILKHSWENENMINWYNEPCIFQSVFKFDIICVSICQRIKIKPTNMYIASARAQFKYTGVEIDTCAFQTGCQLSCEASGMSLGLCFFTQFQWHEVIMLDNWLLAVLPQSGGREFNPRRVHDNLSVPLWVYVRFPVPEHHNETNKYV